MSKKTKKLQIKLYKALTKYLHHIDNKKNHCLSRPIPDSFLDQLATFRMETGIPTALTKDMPYQKAQMNNPVPVSLLSGDRKPQSRFLGNHHSGSGNLYHKSFRM